MLTLNKHNTIKYSKEMVREVIVKLKGESSFTISKTGINEIFKLKKSEFSESLFEFYNGNLKVENVLIFFFPRYFTMLDSNKEFAIKTDVFYF